MWKCLGCGASTKQSCTCPKEPMAPRTPEELIARCLSNAETLVALDHEGAYVGRGSVRSFEMDFREAAAALTEARKERDEAQRTVRSIAAMLGWLNVAPRETLERNISALRERAEATEAENDRLRKALREYGQHKATCNRWVSSGVDWAYINDLQSCTCGFAAAFSGGDHKET